MNIMIIGGTSGIGLALATHYAAQGAQLALCSRDTSRLDRHRLATDPRVRLYQFDIADCGALTRAMHDFGSAGLDLLIVTAGEYADAAALALQPVKGIGMVQTNVLGLVHVFDAAGSLMKQQGYGQLAVIASIAALLKEYPGGSLYSASKRAAMAICSAYRQALMPFGIVVTTILPGYVDTARLRELNGGNADAKLCLQSETAAVKRIVRAIELRAERCVFPWQLQLTVWLFNQLPIGLRKFRRK